MLVVAARMGHETRHLADGGDDFAPGSPERATAVVRRVAGPGQWGAGRAARREELLLLLLLYLALGRSNDATTETPGGRRAERRIGRPKVDELPEGLRHDVRDFFGTYAAAYAAAACAGGDALLFAAGDRARLEEAEAAAAAWATRTW